MANSKKDENGRSAMTAASSANGSVVVAIKANPSSHGLKFMDATTGSDNGNNGGNALIDENGVAVLSALSSDGSGTIIELYADSATGALLINSM